MRKDQLKFRTEGNGTTAPLTSDESDAEANGSTNDDPLSADPFDSLLKSKQSEAATPKKSNGVAKKIPSPVPDDSDTEKDDTETEAEPSKLNESTASEANNGDDTENGEEEEEEAYEVEDIVGHRYRNKKKWYRIRWKNYTESDDTWELEDSLSCPELIASYLEKNPDKETKPKKDKKVRISLPPSREAPKRTAAEKKSLVESEQDSDTGSVADDAKKKKKKVKSPAKAGRGRPKKTGTQPEYEVDKIVDEETRNGKKYYRIRWKGYGAKSDTWEPKNSLNCPDKIKEYENGKNENQDYEVEKIVGEKIEKGRRYFLVKWKNWPEDDNSWEGADHVDCEDLIEKFRDSCRSTKSNKRPAQSSPAKSPKSKKARKDDSDEEIETDPLSDEQEWEVEKIIDERKRGGKKEYRIRWKNCDASQDTWEPQNGINCPELLAAFAKKKKK